MKTLLYLLILFTFISVYAGGGDRVEYSEVVLEEEYDEERGEYYMRFYNRGSRVAYCKMSFYKKFLKKRRRDEYFEIDPDGYTQWAVVPDVSFEWVCS